MIVLSLPIRNWNKLSPLKGQESQIRFESTYKELKYMKEDDNMDIVRRVLSLPIRNWNTSQGVKYEY